MKKTALKKRRNRKLVTYFFLFSAFFLSTYIALFILYPLSQLPVCANSISCIKDLSGKPESATIGIFMNQIVSVPQITNEPEQTHVLGEATPDEKHIYVDLTNQRLLAYEGEKLKYSFVVSTGKNGKTPTGDFHIWVKLRATRMSGGSKELGTYYDLPNVPYTMFFYNDKVKKNLGYGIHGAYWHPNFGHPSSPGCINLTPEDAKTVYDWASPETKGWRTFPTDEDPGTEVTIYGEAPLE